MNTLLDLRHSSSRPTHFDELRQLFSVTATETLQWARGLVQLSTGSALSCAAPLTEGELTDDNIMLPHITQDVEKFINRMANSLRSEPEMWDIVALYHEIIAFGGEGAPEAVRETLRQSEADSDGMSATEVILRRKSVLALRDCRIKQVAILYLYFPNFSHLYGIRSISI